MAKVGITCLCFAVYCIGGLKAQTDPGVYSARSFGLAGIVSSIDNIDAAYFNPAGVAILADFSAHAGGARSFGLSQLTQGSAAVALPIKSSGVPFLRASHFGYSTYAERQVGIGYAMRLNDQINLGARFDLFQLSIDEYGSVLLPGFTIGIQFQPVEQVTVAFVAENPIEITSHESVTLPTRLAGSVTYRPGNKAAVFIELEKDIDYNARVKFGVEYSPIDALVIRTGMAANPGQFHAGFGLKVSQKLRVDLGAGFHPRLGFTPIIGITFTDKKTQQ